MEELTLSEESALQGGFYVPQFELRIDGVSAPNSVVRDITQVTYKDSIKEIDSFEITVNNWDATTRRPKYIGSLGHPRGRSSRSRSGQLRSCSAVVSMRSATTLGSP